MSSVPVLVLKTITTLQEWMVKKIGVAAVSGSSFFKENINNYVRFHFAKKKETLTQALERLSYLPE